MRKKALSPAHRWELAKQAVDARICSQRAACRILRLARSTYSYRGRVPSSAELQMRRRLHELSQKHPRYSYRRIAALLREEGWRVGKRPIQRLRRQEGLRVPPTKRKQVRRGISTGLPTRATHRGHVWTWDFIADATVRGGALRMLTILDEYTRECNVLRADRALRSADVLEWMGKAIHEHGAPEYLRSDNGSEFIAKEVQRRLKANQIKTIYIEPGTALDADRGSRGDRGLPSPLQPVPTAQQARLPESGPALRRTRIHLPLQSAYGLLTRKMDKSTKTT